MPTPPSSDSVDTHISTLFFAGERVYKLVKRVDFPFLRTVDAAERLHLADRELELNRRFAPDVYLGTADVSEGADIVDRMIVMRRLPEDRRLADLLAHDDATACLRDVARQVASIHASAVPIVDPDASSVQRLEQNWRDNFDAIRPHVGSVIDQNDFDAAQQLAEQYLVQTRTLRRARVEQGNIRDGHGDLTASDIFCLDDGPRILDCLAFDDELRIDDVLNDVAFLAMDVHRLSGPHAARTLMTAYHEFTNEQHPPSLAHHYVAYRAHVRTKIACLRAEQGDHSSVDLARQYHDLTLHHLKRARMRVVMIGGGPGVGKTCLAQRLADHYGFVHLATDEIRHDVGHIPHGQHAFAAPDTGAYSPEIVSATYEEQLRGAGTLLTGGYGVVLDASWSSAAQRSAVQAVCAEMGIDLVQIECVLNPAIARERIARRLANPDDPSDATPDLVDVMAARSDPWSEARRLDTAPSLDSVVWNAVSVIDSAL
jgi:aminoglycoside phosphotransferase family enzyme/predicted kinase